ncbi:MAG: hypothetical protein M3Q03_04560 [Chloroflexota bacterium]|nr:hypothetical protein [Chloroflexota bacterium]
MFQGDRFRSRLQLGAARRQPSDGNGQPEALDLQRKTAGQAGARSIPVLQGEEDLQNATTGPIPVRGAIGREAHPSASEAHRRNQGGTVAVGGSMPGTRLTAHPVTRDRQAMGGEFAGKVSRPRPLPGAGMTGRLGVAARHKTADAPIADRVTCGHGGRDRPGGAGSR